MFSQELSKEPYMDYCGVNCIPLYRSPVTLNIRVCHTTLLYLVMEINHKKNIFWKFCYCACIIPREQKKSLDDARSLETAVCAQSLAETWFHVI